MRMRVLALAVGMAAGLTQGATLEKLTLDQMIAKSTAIVRGRVTGTYAAPRGPMIYTHYTVQVAERWKGPETAQLDIVVPGGTAGGLRLTFSGAPRLAEGAEYVLFLWTGSSGLTHIIGLSQGVFDLQKDGRGVTVALREAAAEMMLDSSGQPVKDQQLRVKVEELRRRVATALAGGARQ